MSIIERIPNDSAKDICHLNLTNHRMYTLSLDHLYRSVFVRRPWLLLRTLCASPELGSRVRQLTWKHGFDDRDDTKENQAILLICIRMLELSETDGLTSDTNGSRRDDEFLEILLMFTPNIDTLVVADKAFWPDDKYWFTNIANNPDRFIHLKSINIHGPLSVEAIAYLFLLPSLRDFTASDLVLARHPHYKRPVWDEIIPIRTVLDPASSRVENITLKRSVVEVPTLRYFTEACKQLKSFSYEQDINNGEISSVRNAYETCTDLKNLYSRSTRHVLSEPLDQV
jgi:hypothetical protein